MDDKNWYLPLSAAAATAAASWRWITLTEHWLIYALVRRRYKNVTCQKMCLLLQSPKINRCDHKQSTFKHRGSALFTLYAEH